ncbi:MAG: ribosomal RNA small subunit methyltransferase A [Flavobacteriales bacterium]|nr:ribosomal RNA small subunit methyltransferase A [Flavobacteriales bacterium]|tara:strand:- start:58 stop:822 length:765 start_codon:yes stop_codon:yes gene_type:complete
MTFAPKKYFGQHFLKDSQTANRIVSFLNIDKCDKIIEIGPGKGALTQFLTSVTAYIKVIEIDSEAVDLLKNQFSDIEIIHADFLKLDLNSIPWKKYSIIGNFPYNISTQILFKILEHRDSIQEVVGMFQKEVAERICSEKKSKKYGIPSVLIQAFFKCEKLLDLNENEFSPPPKVKSSVIKLTRNNVRDLGCDYKKFVEIVKRSFSQRRKKIKNALKNFTNLNDSNLDDMMSKRAEELSVSEFVELTNMISNSK